MTQCQSLTKTGKRCTRQASINIDLTSEKLINIPLVRKQFKIPGVNCCFFCKQHAVVVGTFATYEAIRRYLENKLSWEEYSSIFPEEFLKYIGAI